MVTKVSFHGFHVGRLRKLVDNVLPLIDLIVQRNEITEAAENNSDYFSVHMAWGYDLFSGTVDRIKG